MEASFYLAVAFLSFLFFISKWLLQKRAQLRKLPPGPPSIPLIGHLHLLKKPLHQTLIKFADRYGPILHLRFGSRPVLVVSSPSAVEECFTTNDIIFANRPFLLIRKYINYDGTNLNASPYGTHWRNLRRIATLEIFSTTRVQEHSKVRVEEVQSLLQKLFKGGGDNATFRKVEMNSVLFELTFNMVMNMIAGKRYYGYIDAKDLEECKRFKRIIKEAFSLAGSSSLEDFLPALSWVGFNGLKKRFKGLAKEMDKLFQGLIEERRSLMKATSNPNASGEDSKKTIIDVLLGLQEINSEYYTDVFIKGFIGTLMFGGVETLAGTMEWAISLLLNHPEVLKEARAEIDTYVGHSRLIDDLDLSNLPYLHQIIKETLRLFPAGPLLVPHESSGICSVGGYSFPAGTMLLVNAYAIHRDPKLWDDPTMFKPERFEGADQKQSYKMIPFGLGRRGCPGEGLAMRVMGLALGALIQCFEWERVGEEMVDMTEGEGSTLTKAKLLEAMCKERKCMVNVLSQL